MATTAYDQTYSSLKSVADIISQMDPSRTITMNIHDIATDGDFTVTISSDVMESIRNGEKDFIMVLRNIKVGPTSKITLNASTDTSISPVSDGNAVMSEELTANSIDEIVATLNDEAGSDGWVKQLYVDGSYSYHTTLYADLSSVGCGCGGYVLVISGGTFYKDGNDTGTFTIKKVEADSNSDTVTPTVSSTTSSYENKLFGWQFGVGLLSVIILVLGCVLLYYIFGRRCDTNNNAVVPAGSGSRKQTGGFLNVSENDLGWGEMISDFF